MKYKYTLDPTPKKFTCPSCGKKRFVRYINTETGEYLPTEYGRCDRETSCTYHQKPSVTLSEAEGNAAPPRRRVKNPAVTLSGVEGSRIPHAIFRQTMSHYNQNNFVTILLELFPKKTVKELTLNFLFGTSSHWPGATIFWQIDKDHKIRSGQVMLFDTMTRSRVKKPFPHINWVHSILIKQGKLPKDFTLRQCLFGEHQLYEESLAPSPKSPPRSLTPSPKSPPRPLAPSPHRSLAIVESAKTAIIMTAIFPNYLWMATGGSHNIKPEIFRPIKDRNIILYPDLGQYKKWNTKADQLRSQGFKITTSTLLEKNATPTDHTNGLDIADYFLCGTSPLFSRGDVRRTEGSRGDAQRAEGLRALSTHDHNFNSLISKKPNILKLVDAFNLINPKTNKPFVTLSRVEGVA